MATREVYFSKDGVPQTGLGLTWEYLLKVSDGSAFTPQPTFTEIGGGWYKFDINPTEKLVGVIDGSVTLTSAVERYIPVYFDVFDYLYEMFVSPVYDEDNDSLIVAAFLLKNGEVMKTLLTNCDVRVYDKTGTLLFTMNTTSFVQGMAILTKSVPGLIKNQVYYCAVEITYDGEVHTSADSFITLE